MNIENYMTCGHRGHLIGIGGVSMAPLAEVLFNKGISITGSDINDSATVAHLRSLGIPVFIGHRAENLEGADFVVRTAAVRDDNPEVAAARSMGIPVFERTEAWGSIMKHYPHSICVAGTHGKTTTTSMVTHIFMAAEADPTVMIGGTLPLIKAGHRVGHGDTIILEACEYYNSFHNFLPTVAVITNIDLDHVDFFGNLDNVKASFRRFATLTSADGCIICNGDNLNTMDALKNMGRPLTTFGLSDSVDIRGTNITVSDGITAFDIVRDGETVAHIRLKVPGTHNVYNAIAAAAAALSMGIPRGAIEEGLFTFTGAGRRFEYKGSINGAKVYDDYAHHPSELHALIDMITTMGFKRTIVAFQPHTYTRTKALFDDFASELRRVDLAFLAEIYAARETNTIGISSADLADAIPGAVYCRTFDELESKLSSIASEGDIIVTVGAGNIYEAGEHLVRS